VSTEDDEIAAVVRLRGYEVLDRPANLAAAETPVNAVLRHAAELLEWQEGLVVGFQATCPLLRPQTIQRVVHDFLEGEYAWGVTGCPAPHLTWWKGQPLGPRVNRQQRGVEAYPQAESGAMTMWRADKLRGVGGTGCLLFIPPDEALDIGRCSPGYRPLDELDLLLVELERDFVARLSGHLLPLQV